jgi:ribosome modulation factor
VVVNCEPRPLGPHELYWRCRIQGANAYRAGRLIYLCPYGDTRQFSGRAWRDGWRAAAQAAGVKLPHEIAADDHFR